MQSGQISSKILLKFLFKYWENLAPQIAINHFSEETKPLIGLDLLYEGEYLSMFLFSYFLSPSVGTGKLAMVRKRSSSWSLQAWQWEVSNSTLVKTDTSVGLILFDSGCSWSPRHYKVKAECFKAVFYLFYSKRDENFSYLLSIPIRPSGYE